MRRYALVRQEADAEQLVEMKFELLEENDPRFHSRWIRVLNKLRQSNEVKWIQTVFVYDHAAGFFDLLDRRYLSKISEDIDYILTQRWALEISEDDFFHGHVCGKSRQLIDDLDALLSPSNACFLYHTYEQKYDLPGAINRNILSFPEAAPVVVHPKYKFGTRGCYTVSSGDLGLMEYARVYFKRDPEGKHRLTSGTTITIWGKFP